MNVNHAIRRSSQIRLSTPCISLSLTLIGLSTTTTLHPRFETLGQ